MHQVTPQRFAGQSGHFYRPADLSGVAIALVEDCQGRQARLGPYLREAGARVCPVAADDGAAALFRAIAFADVIVVNQTDPEPTAIQIREAGRPIVIWGRLPALTSHVAHVAPEVGPEQLASAVLLRAAVQAAGLDRPDDLTADDLLPRLRTMARLLVHDTGAADDIVEIALNRELDDCAEQGTRPVIGQRLIRLVEQVWREQKLSRLN